MSSLLGRPSLPLLAFDICWTAERGKFQEWPRDEQFALSCPVKSQSMECLTGHTCRSALRAISKCTELVRRYIHETEPHVPVQAEQS